MTVDAEVVIDEKIKRIVKEPPKYNVIIDFRLMNGL